MTDPTPAHWQRYLQTSGVTNWFALSPEIQQHLAAQFPAWQRRQQVIGRVILAVVGILVVTLVLVVIATTL